MELGAVIKKNARRALAGYGGPALALAVLAVGYHLLLGIVASLIALLAQPALRLCAAWLPWPLPTPPPPFTPVAVCTAAVGALLTFLLGTPLTYGIHRWFYLRGGGCALDFGDVFFYFGSLAAALKCLRLELAVGLRCLFWHSVFLLPGACLWAAAPHAAAFAAPGADRVLTVGFTLSAALLLAAGACVSAVFVQRYMPVRYLYFAFDHLPAGRILRLSAAATRRRRLPLALFYLSFSGWLLLMPLGFPLLCMLPYAGVALGLYARLLIHEAALSGLLGGAAPENSR